MEMVQLTDSQWCLVIEALRYKGRTDNKVSVAKQEQANKAPNGTRQKDALTRLSGQFALQARASFALADALEQGELEPA